MLFGSLYMVCNIWYVHIKLHHMMWYCLALYFTIKTFVLYPMLS